MDTLAGAKAREGVRIRQLPEFDSFWHPHIMPTFRPGSTGIWSYENRPGVVIMPFDLPIRIHEDPRQYGLS
ncbi:MAG: hypothetical protein ACRESR_04600 [Gammaproteobacteria bacterium]